MPPREHGSWAVFLAPVLLGLFAVSGAQAVPSALFFIGALAGFLTRTPIQALARNAKDPAARRWLAIYAAGALAGFAPLALAYGRWNLLLFGLAVAPLLYNDVRSHLDKRALSLSNELAGILGLTLGAPAAFYAARGELPATAWTLWLLCAFYFAGPILSVKMAALQHRAAGDASALPKLDRAKKSAVTYHCAVFAAASLAAGAGWIPWLAAAPFAASLAKTGLRASRGPERVKFQTLGWQEVALSVSFLGCLLLGYRLTQAL